MIENKTYELVASGNIYAKFSAISCYNQRIRRDAGVVELACLENKCAFGHRGFESPSLRQIRRS